MFNNSPIDEFIQREEKENYIVKCLINSLYCGTNVNQSECYSIIKKVQRKSFRRCRIVNHYSPTLPISSTYVHSPDIHS